MDNSADIPSCGSWELRNHPGALAAEIPPTPGRDLLRVDAGGGDGADAGSCGEGPWQTQSKSWTSRGVLSRLEKISCMPIYFVDVIVRGGRVSSLKGGRLFGTQSGG